VFTDLTLDIIRYTKIISEAPTQKIISW